MRGNNHDIETDISSEKKGGGNVTRRILKVFFYFIVIIVLIPILVWVTVQIPVVQQWGIHKMEHFMEDEFGAKMRVGSFRISFSDILALEDVEFYGPEQDTLLIARELKVSLAANILSLFNNRIYIDGISISDGAFHYKIFEEGDNFSFLNKNPDRQRKKSNFHFDINQIFLQNFNFYLSDIPNQIFVSSYFKMGDFTLNQLKVSDFFLDIEKGNLLEPTIIVRLENKTKNDQTENLSQELPTDDEELIEPMSKSNFRVHASSFMLRNGTIKFINNRGSQNKNIDDNTIDFNNLGLLQLNLELEDFRLHGDEMDAIICNMRFNTKEGFQLNRLEAGSFGLYHNELFLNQMILETPQSFMSDSITFFYSSIEDFENFEDLVFLDIRIKNSLLAMQDLFYFAPEFRNNTFFKNHSNNQIRLKGVFNGRINNLRGTNLDISFADKARYIGNFSSRSLTNPDETILNLDVQSLRSDMISLRQLIPGLNLPSNFNKLGAIQFTGKFDGFYQDFVTYGRLTSGLGVADIDMKLNTIEGIQKATYSGGLSLFGFDLKKWTGNDDFGRLSMKASVNNGRGLTLDDIKANLNASISSLQFKNYEYTDIQFNGVLNKDLLDGQVIANDKNMQLDFLGTIDFSGTDPVFKFTSQIDLLDLGALNLVNAPFSFSADMTIDATYKDISNIDGIMNFRNLIVAKSDLHFLHVGDLSLESRYLNRDRKMLKLNSSLLNLDVNGNFDFQNIWSDVLTVFTNQNKLFAEKWKLPIRDSIRSENDFDFDLQVINTKNLAQVLDIPLDTVKDLRFKGHFKNSLSGQFEYDIQQLLIPRIKYKDFLIEGLIVKADGTNGNSEIILHVDHGLIGNIDFEAIDGLVYFKGDTIEFNLGVERSLKSFQQIGIVGKYFLVEGRNHIEFNNLEFDALERRWSIQEKNFLQIDDNFLYARNMLFSDGSASVNFSTFDESGLHCQMNNLDISLLNQFFLRYGLEFNGTARADLYVQDYRKMSEMTGNAFINQFVINDIPVGNLKLSAEQKNFDSPIYVELSAIDENKKASSEGFIFLPNTKIPAGQNRFEFNTTLDNYSVALGDVFLKGLISGTSGTVSGQIDIAGESKINSINGDLTLNNVQTRLDYLGTQYNIIKAPVKITNTIIDFGDLELYDEVGNIANVNAEIKHDFFNEMNISMRVTSPQFQVLNTTKKDNEQYYGRAFGKIDMRMNGPFDKLDIIIQAETGPNTVVALPLKSAVADKEQNFIVFTNPQQEKDEEVTEAVYGDGLNLQMYLTINPAAELQLIFDERTGEIIKGRGNGNIHIDLPRDGDFQMYGDFEIERGEYPFKAFVVLDKAFTIKRGGTISWYGDPLNAFINLQAEYKGLRTSPYNFIYDYIRNDVNLLNEAKRPTDVDLILNLNGQLLEPKVQFDIAFPNLQGELKNYTDNRLRTLSANPDELNMTAVSLLAFQGFLPQTTDLLSGAAISNTVSSTLTEWVTNQMRVFVNEYLVDSLSSNSIVSNLNLDFGIVLNPAIEVDGQPSVAGLAQSQFYLRPQFQFLDDRVTLDMGLITYGDVTAGGRVGGEFNVEYAFGDSRRLRARAYAQNQPLINDNRIVSGIGLVYRREYNRFADIFGLGKNTKTIPIEIPDPSAPTPEKTELPPYIKEDTGDELK